MNLLNSLPTDLSFGLSASTLGYAQAGLIIVLLFVLVLSMAHYRRHLLDWSMKGALFGVFFGFLIALIIEGFLILGGRTAVTELLGWKDAPKPIITLLDAGKMKLVQVLGISTQIPSSVANGELSSDEIIELYQSLDPGAAKKAKTLICQ